MGQIEILTHEEARQIADKAIELLTEGRKTASICVMNNSGEILTLDYMDGCRKFTRKVAFLKAEQSALTGERTATLAANVGSDEMTPELYNIEPQEFVTFAGGVPIHDKKGSLLGAIGISNLSAQEDESYAARAVQECGFVSDRPKKK